MKKIKFIIVLLFLGNSFFSQTTFCEKIYNKPDTLAQYKSGKADMRQYVNKKLIPILGECIKQKIEFVYSLEIKYTIDHEGNIIAVDFLSPVLSDFCSAKLRAEILTMKGWKPAILNGNKVCSYFIAPVANIKWQ